MQRCGGPASFEIIMRNGLHLRKLRREAMVNLLKVPSKISRLGRDLKPLSPSYGSL
jgi:hypothetical protein